MPKINDIVKDYFPDFEIPNIESSTTFSLSVNANSLSTLSSMVSSSVDKITEGLIEGLAKILWNVGMGTVVAVEGTVANIGIGLVNLFRTENKQLEYIDVGDAIDSVAINFRDKKTKLSSSKRTDVKNEFIKNKSTYRSSINNDIKNKFNSDMSLKSQLNEKGRSEIKNYIKAQIASARLMLN